MNKSTPFCLVVALVLVASATAQGRVSYGESGTFSVDVVTAVGDDANGLPQVMTLTSVYPNPFNPRTTIAYELAVEVSIELAIFDLRGRLVRIVESTSMPSGQHQATWNGCDANGRAVPAGTYFCRLATSLGSQTKKLTLAR